MSKAIDRILQNQEMQRAVYAAQIARRAAELIRQAREAKGLTQAALAKELGVSQPFISQIESGKVDSMPSLATLSDAMFVCGKPLFLGERVEWATLGTENMPLDASGGVGKARYKKKSPTPRQKMRA